MAAASSVALRHEFYPNVIDDAEVLVIASAGRSPNHTGATCIVKAVAAELLLPISKRLEVMLPARADNCADAGSPFKPSPRAG